jgi:hypothetical protein
MWLFTTSGFYSAVQADDDPDTLIVRTRFRKDAEYLQRWVQEELDEPSEFIVNPKADYLYRVKLSRRAWTQFVYSEAEAIDYGNFKAAALDAMRADAPRDRAYHSVWAAMAGAQAEARGQEET